MRGLSKAEFGDQATRWNLAACRYAGRRLVLLTLTTRDSRKVTFVLGWRDILSVCWGLVLGLVRG